MTTSLERLGTPALQFVAVVQDPPFELVQWVGVAVPAAGGCAGLAEMSGATINASLCHVVEIGDGGCDVVSDVVDVLVGVVLCGRGASVRLPKSGGLLDPM